jgi:hypothetical protein
MNGRWIWLGVLGLMATACARGPVPIREIYFYRDADVNAGRPCPIDIVYPKDEAEMRRITAEIGPRNWFTSSLYDQVRKDKEWLEKPEQTVQRLVLQNKAREDPYVVIIAEFTQPDANPAVGREPMLIFSEQTRPKPRKVEHIAVHNGSLERLARRPRRAP